MNRSDEELVRSVLEGDIDAFSVLADRYANALYAISYQILGDYHEAQDAAQESFIKAYHRLHQLKEPGQFAGWLYSIHRRVSLDMKRRSSAKQWLSLDESLRTASADSPETVSERAALSNAIREQLKLMGEANGLVVAMYYLSELSLKQIGCMLGISSKAVESRLRRGRNFLKQHLPSDFIPDNGRRTLPQMGLQEQIMNRLIRGMKCLYIPVTNKTRSIEWFVRWFGISFTAVGNPILPSGETLYFLESKLLKDSPRSEGSPPIAAFSATHIKSLHSMLLKEGASPGELQDDNGSLYFTIRDPDNNLFLIRG